ncbi:4626_t:CDS:1 [Racocetra persica]|uniref:4626_t:CDS:1 n=1 Tax=Racocetra persica TaxID=160502 RepID=A0ACA9QPY9_9GLOM|nr:4626_t:CDS:1 [Racocetra persica]
MALQKLSYNNITRISYSKNDQMWATRIGSKTARAMCMWSHFHFWQHLDYKAREYPWCRTIICTKELQVKLVDSVVTSTTSWVDLKYFVVLNIKQNSIGILMVLAIFFFATLLKKSQFKLT